MEKGLRLRDNVIACAGKGNPMTVPVKILSVLAGLSLAGSARARIWTNDRGATVVAVLVAVRDAEVDLKLQDGRVVAVPRNIFSGADQEKQCGVLSGGERNRLHLALTLKADANVLLLDEPTNDIDVNTLRALEEGLENFAGCAVVVSHDRWFLDRICTHILSFEGDSNVVFYEGSYSEYEEHKRAQLGDIQPKRVRYRKLIAD